MQLCLLEQVAIKRVVLCAKREVKGHDDSGSLVFGCRIKVTQRSHSLGSGHLSDWEVEAARCKEAFSTSKRYWC